ncbi:reverse transcriptase domain-containing protein [Tanacetum coccineum]
MRTRSSSNLVGESSPNPTTSNPKRRNRRRSKQPFSLEESPVDTMADQRTMAELLRAPTEGYAEAIVVPPILAEHFELKHSLINMMTSDQFFGLEKDNPHDHIRWFNKITSTIKYKDVPNSAIKLMLFPFSLAGAARRWLEKEPPRSILTWEDLVSKFINEFFPPSRTTNLRNEISNFQQRFDESFHEAWDRYKDLLRACPHHGFTELHQLDTFYNALNPADQDSLNSAAGGNLLERRTQDVLTIIENKSKCLAADGNTFLEFRDNIQGYVSAAAVNYNQGNSGYRPPGSPSYPSTMTRGERRVPKPMKTRPCPIDTKLTKEKDGLWYPKGTGIETVVYADSDHAGDYVDQKSTSGICTFMGCCLTSWFSKKQTALAISTIEAEYVSVGKACQQALWMKQALIDYDVRLDDVPIMCNDKGVIDLSKNSVQHSRTKHIEKRHHFLRVNVQKGHISIEKVSSVDNIADILTKPLKHESFNYLHGQVRHIRREEEINVLEYQVLTREIKPTLKPLEEIIWENVFCLGSNRDHVPACLCYMLYCVLHSERFNLAYFMAKRMEWVTKQKRLILPYGMLLTRLFTFIMNEYPELNNESYVLYDRVMTPLAAQLERKPRRDRGMRRGRHSTSSSAFDQPLHRISTMGMTKGPRVQALFPYSRLTEIINRQVPITRWQRGGARSIRIKVLEGCGENMIEVSNERKVAL